MMKIVFLGYLHGFGGAERQIVMLANAMASRGHNVTLVSLCDDNQCYRLDEEVKYIFLPDKGFGKLKILFRYEGVKKILKKIKPDLTVHFWYQTVYLTSLMRKKYVGKIIFSERGDPGDSEYSGLLGIARRLTLPQISGFVFQTRGAQSYFDKKIQERSTVIYNPVFVMNKKSASDVYDVSEQKNVIINVGRLHPQKNQKLLIDAFSIIADQFPNYTLEIYGEGGLKSDLQSQIDKLNLSNRVFLKGTSKKIHEIMQSSSLFVLSSDYEGMPNALLEAMALGLPCISTDCRPGGAREVITDGVDGIITKLGDKNDLAKAMAYLISNPKKREELSENAVMKMAQFQPAEIYDEWESFFLEKINNN